MTSSFIFNLIILFSYTSFLYFYFLIIMDKNRNSTKVYSVHKGDNKPNDVEQAPLKKSVMVETDYDAAQESFDSRGHSTPKHRRDYTFDVEDSPELDYHCSPISYACTQDGGIEVAWDWQTSANNSLNDKAALQNNQVGTPKRTKQLQKKRNSNSPLLQKPLKRKQVKMENIENIGKLTAELKALSEKMQSIQQNCKDHVENKQKTQCELESKLVIELDDDSSEDIMADVVYENEKPQIDGSDIISGGSKKGSGFEDLFDDSIDDSMVKCSQEIEEKLNLCKSKGSDIMEPSTVSENAEVSSPPEKESHYLSRSNKSSETSKSSSISKSSSSSTSGYLKTYSNNSSKTTSMFHLAMSNKKNLNNNVRNLTDTKQKLQDKTVAEFPDDSFDDCLATCIEDDKALSKLSEYDFSPSKSGHNPSQCWRTPKPTVSNTLSNRKTTNNLLSKPAAYNAKSINREKSILITDDLVDEVEIIKDKKAIRKLFPSKNPLENRKFFKTKSLSDQSFYQNRNAAILSNSIKGLNSIVSADNRSQTNSVNPPVSTLPIVRDQNLYRNDKVSSINGMENARLLNRLEEKEAGNCIVKYKSTSNLYNIKMVKESQSAQCTPEEIERKRLEAKMKLEAKRKLQQTNTSTVSTMLEVPVKKSVKR